METYDFAKILTSEEMNIGYIPGSKKVLFIKTGQGGSIYGYENRYLNLGIEVNKAYGFSVFVSATITDTKEIFQKDIKILEELIGSFDFEVYYIGVSKGGLIGCWYAADEARIQKIISINAPLMINFHNKTMPGINKLGKDKLTMVYGTLDPSYKYVPFVEAYAKIKILEGADHNLRNSKVRLREIYNLFM